MSDDPTRRQGDDSPESSDLLSKPIYNWLSVIGTLLAGGSLTAAIFFFLVGIAKNGGAGYSGLIFLPPVVIAVVGVFLVAVGYVREVRRQRRGHHSSFHRKWVIAPANLIRGVSGGVIALGIVLTTLMVLSAGAGSLMLVDYTESNEFCGETCHSVMAPEAIAYADSPHSRIACVECHVGSGGDSYINAKLNGLAQVYGILSGDFSRPIRTPIHGRRPSSDMCGACHPTGRLNEYKAISRSYFLSGEVNEHVGLRMMMKVGSGGDGLMHGEGIHYHMLIENTVEYIARDPQRQDIPWVRVTNADGVVREYENENDPLDDAERASLEVRQMECLDCHSRPAHRFQSPMEAVNEALADGRIDSKVPYIKAAAVVAIDAGYATTEEAISALPERLREYYEENHPDEFEEHSAGVEGTVPALQDIYARTIFPEMKADWLAHPDNIGHRRSLGCFRCHNDEMVDDEGETIFTDCSRCHAILAQGENVVEVRSNLEDGTAFVHPEDWETIEEFTLCSDCHTGGADLYE